LPATREVAAATAAERRVVQYRQALLLRHGQQVVGSSAVTDRIVDLHEVELVLAQRGAHLLVLAIHGGGHAQVADLAGGLVLRVMRHQLIEAVDIVDLQQVDLADAEATEGVVEHGLATGDVTGQRRLGGEEELVPVAQVGQQLADHLFGSAIGLCGVDDRTAETGHGRQHLAQLGQVLGAAHAIGIGAHSHRRKFLSGGRNGPHDHARFRWCIGCRGKGLAHCDRHAGCNSCLDERATRKAETGMVRHCSVPC